MDALVRERPAQQGLRPALDAERFLPSRLAGLRDDGAGAAERPHRDDAEPELGGERQDLALGLPLARVVRHLDRLDPAGSHDACELVEGATPGSGSLR